MKRNRDWIIKAQASYVAALNNAKRRKSARKVIGHQAMTETWAYDRSQMMREALYANRQRKAIALRREY